MRHWSEMSEAAPAAAEPQRSSWLRRLAPWVVAAGILAFLLYRTDFDDLSAALEHAALWQLGLLAIAFVTGMVLADSLSMWVGFRAAIPEVPLPFGQVFLIRGASYLLAVVNYAAGQGGIAYFLARRHEVPVGVSAGAVLLTAGSFIIVVTVVVGAGLLAGAVPDMPELRWVAIAVVASLPLYFGIIALRPKFLARISLLKPLFDAGVLGTLKVAAARGVHLGVLILGHWTAMRIFGVDVPAPVALALLPVLFLVTAIPISPSGLGTTQAAAITLFGAYASAADEPARQAQVLAYSLSFHVLGTALAVLLGLVCLRKLTAAESDFDSDGDAP
jgi:uncharacterized membrane protein YbhN (UPF0104 family)